MGRIADLLAWFLEWIGVKASEEKKLSKTREELEVRRTENQLELERLKEQLRRLRAQAKKKWGEFESASSDERRIVRSEIEQIFSEIDQQEAEERIYARNISAVTTTIAKVREIEAARRPGVSADRVTDLTVDLEELIRELREADKELASLRSTSYQPKEREAEVAAKQEEVEQQEEGQELGETAAEQNDNMKETEKKHESELPDLLKKRLQDLDAE